MQIQPKTTLSIAKVCSASSDLWDKLWKECDYATYFHSREWAEIWSSYTLGKLFVVPKLVIFSDGKEAILPLCGKKQYQGLVDIYFSSVEGCFGGWISTDNLGIKHAVLMSEFLTKKLNGSLIWRLNPYDELASESGVKPHWSDETYAVNLEKDFTTLYTSQSSTVRKAKKASKAGVLVKVASTIDEWKEYYQAYKSTLSRWGDNVISEYRWDLFYEIFQLNSPNVKLWIALYDDKIVSGAICFYAKKHVVYWHGASLEEYFQLRPVNLLMYEIMKDAHFKNYRWFDFNPSAGLEGVVAFKKSFGASPLPCPLVVVETPVGQLFNKIGYRMKKCAASLRYLK
jgi:hypothetical protein